MTVCQKICINCPAGCHLEITKQDSGEIIVKGNNCPRGEAYARQEMTDPRRIVTAVVMSDSRKMPCIPVKTTAPVPMAQIAGLLKHLFRMKVALPVEHGQVIVKDYNGTGIDVIATRKIER